jgi:phage terminase large subunit
MGAKMGKTKIKATVAPHNYKFLLNSEDKRIVLMVGGAGSTKSWSLVQYLILEKLLKQEKINILVVRKTFASIKASCIMLFTKLLDEYQIPYDINKSEAIIRVGNNTVTFKGLDLVERLKSLENCNYIFIEEATEVTADDFRQLNIRMRSPNPYGVNQIFCCFNPTDPSSFLKTMCEVPDVDTAVCHSTYKNNPFLSKEYKLQLENLITQDQNYYRVYCLGEWATLENIIYNNWDICPDSEWPAVFEEESLGLDFGFANSPTALLEINRTGMHTWERERIFETHLTNTDLIKKLGLLKISKEILITADCARPDSIEEIEREGYNIIPCIKGPGSVAHGIDCVCRFLTHLHEDSQNLIRQKRNYRWQTDRSGNILGKPVKWDDDLLDAERYDLSRHKSEIPALFPLADDNAETMTIEIDPDVVEARRRKNIFRDDGDYWK